MSDDSKALGQRIHVVEFAALEHMQYFLFHSLADFMAISEDSLGVSES